MSIAPRDDVRWCWFRHGCVVLAIVICVCFVYWYVTQAYFCSDDDFLEVHRAAFEDTEHPARIFTTSHFGTFKYRPLNRLVNLLTYEAGGGRAWLFRVRNLAGHALNVVAVYVLAVLLGQPILVAAVAALLFGIHPMANQSVIGAVMTNTLAATAFLAALISLLAGMRSTRTAGWWAAFALAATVGVFLYDTYIVVFPCASICVLLFGFMVYRRIPWAAAGAIVAATIFCLGLYTGLRARFVPSGYASAAATLAPVRVMAANTAAYAAALLLPIDPVLQNELFGAPFPSDPRFHSGVWRLAAAGGAAVAALAVAGMFWVLLRRRLPFEAWTAHAFLAAAAVFPLIPVLLISEHPSETYLYSTVAFWILLVTSIGFACTSPFGRRGQAVFVSVAAIFAALFGTATFVRNGRVAACGHTAQAVLASVPLSKSNTGGPLVFAGAPGEPTPGKYGFYSFQGLDTVTNRPGIRSRTLQCALQIIGRDKRIAAEVTDAHQLENVALHAHASAAFLVHRDGRLTRVPLGNTVSRAP